MTQYQLKNIYVRCDPIEVTTIHPPMLPDPKWVEVDANGHEHRFDGKDLPTVSVISEDWVDADGDEHTDWYYTCRECGEDVSPRWMPDPRWCAGVRQYLPGPISGSATFAIAGPYTGTPNPGDPFEYADERVKIKGYVTGAEIKVDAATVIVDVTSVESV